MKVTLHGAAYEVTGSCYLVEAESARILIDCGMFQGSARLEKLNRIPADLRPLALDAVLLTHGHLDHCGRLPLLSKEGFRGPIFATPGTIDIATLILKDAARIQQDDLDRENRKRKRMGLKPVQALYSLRDVQRVCEQFRTVSYEKWEDVAPGIRARYVEAGHILGSSSIELEIQESDGWRHVVFSGDVGQWDTPIVRDPVLFEKADLAFVESTYGDRDHRSLAETVQEFEELICHAVANKGKILIPTFAVGRTQQILYHLAELFRKKLVPPFPIYLDSPMAIAATDLYTKHIELMDEEALNLQSSGQLRRDLRTLRACETAEQSKALNGVEGPCVILAGAGMCNAGRILHHLRQNLPFVETVLLIVGYQSRESMGRRLLEGAKQVKIHGETIPVHATIRSLGGFSAHAGQSELLKWMEPLVKSGANIVLSHGESFPIDQLAAKVLEKYQCKVVRPKLGTTLNL